MTINEWVKKEIEISCKKENPKWDGKTFDYGCSCYKSALKAYESLINDGHSGASFAITKNILMRLLEELPLQPITEDDFHKEDEKSDNYLKLRKIKSHIQCSRMSSLFKEEDLNGNTTYNDINRYICIDIHTKISYHNGLAGKILNRFFPITLPYYPNVNKYKIYTEDFLVDKRNGDFDTKAFLYCITPDGEKINLNIFYCEKNNEWVEISEDEYKERKKIKLYKFSDES